MPTTPPNDRIRVLLARFLDVGRCPSCGYHSIVQFARSRDEGMVLSCRMGQCRFHAIAVHFRALQREVGPAPAALVDADDPKPFEHELHTILTSVIRLRLCPACGVHGALVQAADGSAAWRCTVCTAHVGAAHFEVWRYLQSRSERGLPYQTEPRRDTTRKR